jgi:hypothetical protein
MDLGFEDYENKHIKPKFASNELTKLESREGLSRFVQNSSCTRTPLLKKNAVEISRIPLQEALKNGNGIKYNEFININ